eukprot:1138757-Amphidinium_carterae.1
MADETLINSARRLLGKHSDLKDRTMLVYSRDTCMATLHEVAKMFADIQAGRFDPDATRSVILRNVIQPPAAVARLPAEPVQSTPDVAQT